MDSVLRGLAVYLVLLLIFRLSGKRSLSQITTFDLVLLLIVSEATQQALLGDDFSLTNAALVIMTLVAGERISDWASHRWGRVDRLVNDSAIVLVEHGRPNERPMHIMRVSVDDVLEQGRVSQGIERLDQVKYAVLERNGAISVIPKSR